MLKKWNPARSTKLSTDPVITAKIERVVATWDSGDNEDASDILAEGFDLRYRS